MKDEDLKEFELGGLGVYMTQQVADRWNARNWSKEDVESMRIYVPGSGGKVCEYITMVEAVKRGLYTEDMVDIHANPLIGWLYSKGIPTRPLTKDGSGCVELNEPYGDPRKERRGEMTTTIWRGAVKRRLVENTHGARFTLLAYTIERDEPYDDLKEMLNGLEVLGARSSGPGLFPSGVEILGSMHSQWAEIEDMEGELAWIPFAAFQGAFRFVEGRAPVGRTPRSPLHDE